MSETTLTPMQQAHREVVDSMFRLLEVWNEEEVRNYPRTLPSFDELTLMVQDILNEPAP